MYIKEIEINGKNLTCLKINLILGANNTGKSTLIKELEIALSNTEIGAQNKWVTGLTIESDKLKTKFDLFFPDISSELVFEETQSKIGQSGITNIFGRLEWNQPVFQAVKDRGDTPGVYKIFKGIARNQDWYYYRFFTRMATSIENCETRLIGPFFTQIEKIGEAYKDIVQYLYAESDLFSKISDNIERVFGIKLTFDDLAQGRKDIRLKPEIESGNQGLTLIKKAKFWEEHSQLLQNQGDGLKAYIKILYSLFNPSKEILLIDEPEAFLHPPQRRSLGQFIAENAANGKQVFISTHDSEFLRGVMTSASIDVQVIHLKNNQGKRSYSVRNLPPTPSRSQNYNEQILNSYFNKLTVLCEAEDDRMIYQHACQAYFPNETVDIYFLGLNGKTSVFQNFNNLISRDINVVVIVDIDVLFSCEYFVGSALKIEETDKQLLEQLKNDLSVLSDADKKLLKEKGIGGITDSVLKKRVEDAIALTKKYGIYVVSVGEMESWRDDTTRPVRYIQHIINEIDESSSTDKKIKLKDFLKDVIKK